MSFILDALKKSELERQRQTMPGLMDAGAVPRRPVLPRWAIALGLLLGVNLIVLAVVLMRGGASRPAAGTTASTTTTALRSPGATGATTAATPSAIAASPAPTEAAPPAALSAAAEPPPPAAAERPGADHFSPLDPPPTGAPAAVAGADAPPVYAPEIPVDAAMESAPGNARPAEHGSRPASQRRDPLLSDPDGADNDEVLPSMSELNLTGANGLPDMHIDVHVFATRPSERFVYINMRRYREGATLQEGPVLERIRRDGAVLNYHGLRFILPRQ